MPVWTVLPRQLMSRGKAMLMDTSRAAIPPPDALPEYHKPFGAPHENFSNAAARHRRKQFFIV
jgi:hypothetical protein